MKQEARSTMRSLAAAALLTLAGAVPCPASERPAQGPSGGAPLRVAGGDVLGYVAVPDLEALLAHVEATSAAIAPGAMPPGAAREGLAQKLGVPGLEGLAAKPILLVFLKAPGPMTPPRTVLFLPVKNGKPYEKALAALGWTTRTASGLLIGASTAEGLAASAPLEAEYRRLANASIAHDLRVFLQVGRLMEVYGPIVQMGMDAAMAPKASPDPSKQGAGLSPAATRFLKLEVKGFLAVLGQLDDVQWDIDLQPEGLASDTVVTARPATALDDLARMPPSGSNRAAALLSGSGVMTGTYQLDPVRLASFLRAIVKETAADPEAAALLAPEVLELVEQVGTAYGGQAAYRMAAAPGAPLAVETVLAVTDEAKAMALIERALALMGPGRPWGTLLEGTGVSIGLQKNVRRHAGVPVHRLKVKLDPKGLTPQQKAAQAPFLRDNDFAITRGYYVSAQDPPALDRLIDRAAAGAPAEGLTLQSAQIFGEGRHMYVDYDVIGLMKAVSAMTPPAKGQPDPFAALPATAEPMLAAMTFGEGRIRWQSRLPLRPFVLMTESFKKAAPSPAPAPSATPSPRRRP